MTPTVTCDQCGFALDPADLCGSCPVCVLRGGMIEPTAVRLACSECDGPLDEGARFCSRCGAPVPPDPAAEGDHLRAALGETLRGQYEILRLLGRGGMGAVYLARDLTLDREVAVKVVQPAADSPELRQRLRREARTAARLAHPNVVPLHAFGEVEGMPYFVMGYIRGESLAARLRREGRLEEGEARRILREVAQALDHAHRQGIVHRDVKPDNILLDDESGRAVLTDFGLAKALGGAVAVTRRGEVMGTPSFMSPEQVAGKAVDHRTDLYSLGVVGYAILAGRLPFEGRETAEVLAKHLTAEPPPLRSLAPTVSDATLSVVTRCLAKDAGERWQDACSLARALEPSEERRLPDALQGVEGQGLPGLVIATAYLGIVARFAPPPVILLLNAALLLAVYLVVLVRLRGEGFPITLTQRTIWTEPSWWLFAYPASLRRVGSVWSRLPQSVRRLRSWIPLLAVVPFVSLLWVKENPGITLILVFAPLVAFDVLWLLASRELDRRGLPKPDRARVALSVPTSRRSFWSQQHVAAVLEPDPGPERGSRLESPHDRLRSILRHGDALQGQLRPIGARAAVAARQLLAEIDGDDAELATLGEELEPGEETRLGARIEALANAEARSEAAAMRQLLERQLDLLRGLTERLRTTEARRQRRVELLRNLDLELALLASTERRPEEASSASGRVRQLCEAIAAQVDSVRSETALDADSQLPTLDVARSTEATSSRIPTQPLGPR